MRVISGLRKGHKLASPKGSQIRPTEDRLKESLFNILYPLYEDALILDLFAGTGSIGIEFLSRGSDLVYFVDKSKDSVSYIKKNLMNTRLMDKALVWNMDAKKALLLLSKDKVYFDYIYIDPPFGDLDLFNTSLSLLDSLNLLKENGLIIVEHDQRLRLNDDYIKIEKVDERKYGNNLITFYKNKEVVKWE